MADVLACTVTLVDLELTTGRLGEAERTVRRAARSRRGRGDGSSRPWHRGHVGGVEPGGLGARTTSPPRPATCRRAGDLGRLPACRSSLTAGASPWRSCERPRATWTAADALLEEAERLYSGDFSPNVRPVAATRARVLARAGDLAAARAWVRLRGLSADDELTYLREYEHVTLARILLAEHRATGDRASLADATSLLERIRMAAEAGGRTGVLIEGTVLHALANDASGEGEQALRSLQRAVVLAEPEGWVRVFVDEGAPLKSCWTSSGSVTATRRSSLSFLRPAQRRRPPPHHSHP